LLYDGPLLCGFNVASKGLIVNVTNADNRNNTKFTNDDDDDDDDLT